MKNVLLTLFILCGLGMTQVMAQTCKPSSECAKFCQGKKSCDPKACQELIAAGKCTPAEVAACKTAVAHCSPSEVEMYKTAVASWTPAETEASVATPSSRTAVNAALTVASSTTDSTRTGASAASVHNTATCAPVQCKSHKAVAQEGTRTKAAKVVTTKS